MDAPGHAAMGESDLPPSRPDDSAERWPPAATRNRPPPAPAGELARHTRPTRANPEGPRRAPNRTMPDRRASPRSAATSALAASAACSGVAGASADTPARSV
eukprot:6189888-Alexandrium_andersonii.AAC.1